MKEINRQWRVARSHDGAGLSLSLWLKDGRLKEVLDIAEGFDAVPDAALGQLTGANTGKQLVHIAAAQSGYGVTSSIVP